MATVMSDYLGEDVELAAAVENMTSREIQWEDLPGDNDNEEKVVINENHSDQPIVIEKNLPPQVKNQLVQLLAQ